MKGLAVLEVFLLFASAVAVFFHQPAPAFHPILRPSSLGERDMDVLRELDARLARAHISRTERRPPLHLEALEVTAYCWTGSRTASGAWPEVGMAAGNRWPFGTRIRVPGRGTVTITDRIGWGSDLDLYIDRRDGTCENEATQWGRRYLKVEVERNGS